MLLSILQYQDSPCAPQLRIIWPKMSVVFCLRSPALKASQQFKELLVPSSYKLINLVVRIRICSYLVYLFLLTSFYPVLVFEWIRIDTIIVKEF